MELSPDDFPVFAELLDSATDEVVWSAMIDGPGALAVPSVAELGVSRVWVRTRYPNGDVEEYGREPGA